MRERSVRGRRRRGGRRNWIALPAALLRPLAGAVMRQPAASIGSVLALAFSAAIVVNALFLQTGPHPAPLLGAASATETTGSLPPVPPPRAPDAGTAARAELLHKIQSELASRGYYDGAVDGIYGPRMEAAIREFQQAAGLPVNGEATETLLSAVTWSTLMAAHTRGAAGRQAAPSRTVPTPPSRRVLAVQRALTEFGYGQLKLTGVVDEATRVAIEKFEQQRKLPVRGQISERFLRELASVTGRSVE